MKVLFIYSLLLAPAPLLAAESFVERSCYVGCGFDGVENAQRTCRTVAEGINSISNEKVQLVATCRLDREGTYCHQGEYCSFPSVVLETKFIVH